MPTINLSSSKADGEKLYQQAQEFFKQNKIREGYEMLEKSAQAGYAEAQFDLATAILEMKIDLPTEDGIKWMTKAAEQNHIFAINNLAICYQTGSAVKKDFGKAIDLLERAASLGDMMAYYNIGQSYFFGLGVEKDIKKALDYIQKAANSNVDGCGYAQNLLGQIYENGIREGGVEISVDNDKAIMWYSRAVESGDEEAKTALARLKGGGDEIDDFDVAKRFQAIWRHYDLSLIDELFDVTFKYSSYHVNENGEIDVLYFKDYGLNHFVKSVRQSLEEIINNHYQLRSRLRKDGDIFLCDTVQNNTMITYELIIESGKIDSINMYTLDETFAQSQQE